MTGCRGLLIAVGLCVLAGCERNENAELLGRPGGPYQLSLALDPVAPVPGQLTQLRFQLTYTRNGKPVSDLQLAHERLIHNFIVDLDFSTFAHIHHEDFAEISEQDRREATFSFPYRFPHAGRYRIVSEFVHRDRSWTKHFDIAVGATELTPRAPVPPTRTATVGDINARLTIAPEVPLAGQEIRLDLRLERANSAVTDLQLHLGTEVHGAVWRDDGRYFGHLHSYTPKVAAILAEAHDPSVEAAARGPRIAQMMAQLMCLTSELVFPGPEVPMRYVFPQAGRYHIFLQLAPGGEPRVFQFVVEVAKPDFKPPADAS